MQETFPKYKPTDIGIVSLSGESLNLWNMQVGAKF